MSILVLDVGGSNVKCVATAHGHRVKIASGPGMTPRRMVREVLKVTHDWSFDVVSIGYPGVVRRGAIVREPFNLGRGWVGFDFQRAFRRPVRIINDAAMQALGGYQGGTMLFLGLGTGLGSALIVDGVIAAMELGHLQYGEDGCTYEDYLGDAGRQRLGDSTWQRYVKHAVAGLRKALLPDYVVLGGGNVRRLKHLPRATRRGSNAEAISGGVRLWDEPAE